MAATHPVSEPCLTPDERQDVQALWVATKQALDPLGTMIEQAQEVDCEALYESLVHFTEVFDDLERAVMRAKQVRLLHTAHTGEQR